MNASGHNRASRISQLAQKGHAPPCMAAAFQQRRPIWHVECTTVRDMNSALARRVSARRYRRMPARWRSRRGSFRRVPPAGCVGSGNDIANPVVPRRTTTLLELVQAVQKEVATDTEVVAIVHWLVNTGAVVLTGSFAGQRI
jgi:hypothetical protein